MNNAIFREYDIRGKVGSDLLLDEVYPLARAIAYYFVQQNPQVRTIAVGMDGRTHSPIIKDAVCRALADSGLDVLFVGMCPSPVLYFALHTCDVDAGLMITASHNPAEYNGIKICLGKSSVWGSAIQEIKQLYRNGMAIDASQTGTVTQHELVPEYIDWLADHFSHLNNMPLSVVIDCGNGAGGTVIPDLVKKMNWQQVQLLYCDVDGTMPNHEADPVVAKNMQAVKQVLSTTDAQVGIGLDGDCDRMAPMTKTGDLILGDRLLALFAQQVIQKHPGVGVVYDIKSSSGLQELLDQWQAKGHMSPSGHAIIKEKMKEFGAMLGGELSCHFFFHDRYFGYDDGIYAMLRLFELLINTGKNLDELVAVFPTKYSSPELRIACAEEDKAAIVAAVKKYFVDHPDAQVITIDGVRAQLPYGWGIVRASNTQPAICIRVEADLPQDLTRVRNEFVRALAPYFDAQELEQRLQ